MEIDLFDFTSFFAWTFLNFMAHCEPITFSYIVIIFVVVFILGLPGVQTWHVNGTSVDEILIPPKISGGPSAEVSYFLFAYDYRGRKKICLDKS